MDPDAIDRVVRKYAAVLGPDRGYSAHLMRATSITTALENSAQLEDVQTAAGHRDPSTTKLYDRRDTIPNKGRAFKALIFEDVLLSPLAIIAFVVGYSIDVITSHLDGYILKFGKPAPHS